MNVKIHGDMAQEAVDATFEKASEIESIMSARLSDSELTYVNDNAFNNEVVISEELYYVIETALYYSELSKGAFDPAIGYIINMWGIGTEDERIPSDEELEVYIDAKLYKHVILNKEKSSIMFDDERVRLDLGGIAKGYTADCIKDMIIKKYGIDSGLISIGGNIITIGQKMVCEEKKDSKDNNSSNITGDDIVNFADWTVAVQSPFDENKLFETLSINDLSVVTAGDYERYFEIDNVKYHHILDPKDAYPADNGIVSASIITDNSMKADVLSTTAFILGPDKAMEFLENIDNVEAILIKPDGTSINISSKGEFVKNR